MQLFQKTKLIITSFSPDENQKDGCMKGYKKTFGKRGTQLKIAQTQSRSALIIQDIRGQENLKKCL